ncbi:hypothetical protein [Streptomyces ficellus]|uniref:Uncharacterized protein n=1 Tax=Streptomyces ficellus TaxID=1977088 RepID=A0A6I6F765_9ACTN|nr:hypothetical protein [Streptomyces ficellus]QGV76847.1 hypothetical protein EIZ62_00085 [Streptomyces ficellus]QGV82361.1 hypothetical protein EIZ62_32010 [Streptomyces ficellus]
MRKQTERVTDRRQKPSGLAMPRQAPPIDRTGATTAHSPGTSPGVEPSNFFKTLTRILDI